MAIAALAMLALPASGRAAAPPYRAVLIAGDNSIPVFDNAIGDVRTLLIAKNLVAPEGMTLLSAARSTPDRHLSTLRNIFEAISSLHPAPGQGCLVYATSHGSRDDGVYLAADKVDLTPAVLNDALRLGCGNAPTVVIVSACFSGQFISNAMRNPNRIILTASRRDRTSFGCQAGRHYTVYDRCLLENLDHASGWREAFTSIRGCVAEEEQQEHVLASDPQGFFGRAATIRQSGF